MSWHDVLLFDTGSSQWRCGRAEEGGPDVVLPGIPLDEDEAWRRQVEAAIEQLEATPSECAIILSEPPGTSSDDRERRADFLFELGMLAVHFAAAPVLAIYDASFDTGMIVDVGERAAYIFAICDGLSILEAATEHPLSHWPGVEEQPDQLPGVLDALVRTLATIDMSLRKELLANVALVGGGSMAADFPLRLERELATALSPGQGRAAPWTPRVVAKNHRRLACWLGGAVFFNIPSGEARFLTRDEYGADRAQLHTRAATVPSLGIDAQEQTRRAAGAAEAEAEAAERRRGAARRTQTTEEARAWWVEQAGAGGAEERARQRSAQRVAGCYLQSCLALLGLAPAPEAAAGPAGYRTSRAPPLPASARVELGAASVRLVAAAPLAAACGDERALWRRLAHLRAAPLA